MTFILILIAVFLVRTQGQIISPQRDAWLAEWIEKVQSSIYARHYGSYSLWIVLLAPILGLFALLIFLHAIGWSLLAHALNLLVLVYSFGRGDIKEDIQTFVDDLKRNDLQAAYHDASAFSGSHDESHAENWPQLHRETLGGISYRHFDHIFPSIFWFALFGGPGALLYRLAKLCGGLFEAAENRQTMDSIAAAMAWVPLKLLGITFAIIGNFNATFKHWLSLLFERGEGQVEELFGYVQSSLGAVGSDEVDSEVLELEELEALFDRALITWLAILALIALIS